MEDLLEYDANTSEPTLPRFKVLPFNKLNLQGRFFSLMLVYFCTACTGEGYKPGERKRGRYDSNH